MRVKYTPTALKHLAKIANYIDDINTRGSGERWIIRFDSFTITDNNFVVKRIIYGPHLT